MMKLFCVFLLTALVVSEARPHERLFRLLHEHLRNHGSGESTERRGDSREDFRMFRRDDSEYCEHALIKAAKEGDWMTNEKQCEEIATADEVVHKGGSCGSGLGDFGSLEKCLRKEMHIYEECYGDATKDKTIEKLKKLFDEAEGKC